MQGWQMLYDLLVRIEGRENLRVVNAWLSRYERFWSDKLDTLRDLAENDPELD